MAILATPSPRQKQNACRLPARGRAFRRRLLAWYARHARKLPWRGVCDPYAVLVSEMMLQQTQVRRVVDFFPRFLARYPTLEDLAAAAAAGAAVAPGGGAGAARPRRRLEPGAHGPRGDGVHGARAALRVVPGTDELRHRRATVALTGAQTNPARQRYSAARTAPLAAPIRVLCESATYLRPCSSAGSARRRPTLVAMPPSASRSRRGCGRKGSSCTRIARAGALGRSSPA